MDNHKEPRVTEQAVRLIQELSRISMSLAADLVQGADYTFQGHDYLDRNFVVDRVMQWRAAWDATAPDREAVVKLARSTRQAAPAQGAPVALCDALRRSGANRDYHGLIAFTPAQFENFVSMIAAPAQAEDARDAARYRAIRFLMQTAKGSASLEVNQHLAYYDQCQPGEEVKLQWYPDTPIGFYTIEGYTIDEVADGAIAAMSRNTGKDGAA